MSEKILAITEHREHCELVSKAGYKVFTEKQEITLLIDDEPSCCERFGYFWTNDDPNDFIGAQLLDVQLTDTALNPAKLKEHDLTPDEYSFEGSILFVDLETDRGKLQFVAYNEHNGYYGHEAIVSSTQLTHEEVL